MFPTNKWEDVSDVGQGQTEATFGFDSQEKWDEFVKLSMLKQQGCMSAKHTL